MSVIMLRSRCLPHHMGICISWCGASFGDVIGEDIVAAMRFGRMRT